MIKPTLFDENFNELNSINLSNNQKAEMWRNINHKAKKQTKHYWKNALAVLSAIAIILVLSPSLISKKSEMKVPEATSPKISDSRSNHKQDPADNSKIDEPISAKNDSSQWEQISRLRYDLAEVITSKTESNKITVTVKRKQSFGTDPDPFGPVFKPDTETQDYILKSSADKQNLDLKPKQTVLLAFAQYQQPNSTDWFWGAELLCSLNPDGKYYDSEGKPATITISSYVKITNGILEIQEPQ